MLTDSAANGIIVLSLMVATGVAMIAFGITHDFWISGGANFVAFPVAMAVFAKLGK